MIKTFSFSEQLIHWDWLVWIPLFPAFPRWFWYGLKSIITFCRSETICAEMHSTIKVMKTFSFPKNLSSGLACSNPTFPAFQRWVLYGFKVIITFCGAETICEKVHYTIKIIKTFVLPNDLLVNHQLIHVHRETTLKCHLPKEPSIIFYLWWRLSSNHHPRRPCPLTWDCCRSTKKIGLIWDLAIYHPTFCSLPFCNPSFTNYPLEML